MEKVDLGDLKTLASGLRAEIFGQSEALDLVIKSVATAHLGIGDPDRPLHNFLFLGPTGVGKSEVGRTLARLLHGDDCGLVILDCNTFKNPHDVARLVGAPHGYIGFDTPPLITTEKLEHAFTVVVFEELEKADDAFFDVLLGLLEDGELTTGKGDVLDFTRSFIIMTSNLGSREAYKQKRRPIGFRSETDRANQIFRKEAEKFFSPEFVNRLDTIVVFEPLTSVELSLILDKFLGQISFRLQGRGLHLTVDESVRQFLLLCGSNPYYGARPMRRAIDRWLVAPVAEYVLEYLPKVQPEKPASISVRMVSDHLKIEVTKRYSQAAR
ncbi:MAG TPA: AAA family ATPase [Candidatus Paceibacterota bacterium]|nr:AAA family ATPase [Candidatus Paceibacterota bacterium]